MDENIKTVEPVISFRDAEIVNGETPVIYGLDMDVYQGDFVYIVGKVGTGKTSIIRTIIAEKSAPERERKSLRLRIERYKEQGHSVSQAQDRSRLPGFPALMDRSVEDNLEFVLRATGWKDPAAIGKRIEEVLCNVGMESKAHKMPHQLSGGEQQRIAIARSLLNEPGVIIADEPTGNLDNETADGIMKLLTSINRSKGTAVVMVTHNKSIFENYPGRVLVCKDEACHELK